MVILSELGLSNSQAKLFLMLTKSKSLTAKAISVVSSVSRPDVYRVMTELQEIGLVEKLITVPEEFQAVSIEEAVSILLRRRIKKTEDLQQKGLDLVRSLNLNNPFRPENGKRKMSADEFIFSRNGLQLV